MNETETVSAAPAAVSPSIPEETMRDAVSAVLAVRLPGGESHVPDFTVSGPQSTQLESVGVDSLLIAEVIVELEERLETLLELRSGTRLETFADLHSALTPASPS
ncbi:phosphopantetheine-binding protein [Streptomyces sp. NBC_00876]|uniref:phosphopantetheine-binding protein n=1 Tax=Streptomyces sp. NBC_00876 TaxID=2975853 RepID=UPI00386D7354|nr:phosphopantetheine-binding protein [Streptomyces sp. NBC_00876]